MKKCGQCMMDVPRKWRDQGFLRIETTYMDGSKRTTFVCPACRAKNMAENSKGKFDPFNIELTTKGAQ